MRLLWITDVHLDFASERTAKGFLTRLKKINADLILVGGDTGEGRTFKDWLAKIRARTGRPVVFVLGNHDYYGSSVLKTTNMCKRINLADNMITWLATSEGVDVSTEDSSVIVIGEGGWGDWAHGDMERLGVRDYDMIEELKTHNPRNKKNVAETLGELAAGRLKKKLKDACAKGYERVIVLTHVPPWPRSAWHEDQPSESEAQPFFVWGRGGQAITEVADKNPETQFTILSGHTHSGGMNLVRNNVTSITAPARYQRPDVAQIMEIE